MSFGHENNINNKKTLKFWIMQKIAFLDKQFLETTIRKHFLNYIYVSSILV